MFGIWALFSAASVADDGAGAPAQVENGVVMITSVNGSMVVDGGRNDGCFACAAHKSMARMTIKWYAAAPYGRNCRGAQA